LVKGTSRRVIVVDSPDPKLFEQAIFIVKNDAFSQEGVTSQQVLGEACRIARSCAAPQTLQPPVWRRVPLWGWIAGAAAIAAAVMAAVL
jgi:negative regulator of sigma E activity